MLAGFLPLLDRVVCTQASEPRSLTADELAAAVARRGSAAAGSSAAPPVEAVADPHAALARARELAGAGGQRPRRGLAVPAGGPARRARGRPPEPGLPGCAVRIYWRKSVER